MKHVHDGSGTSRREFFKHAAVGAVSVAALAAPGCGGGSSTSPDGGLFDAGGVDPVDAGGTPIDAGAACPTCPSTTPSFLTAPDPIPTGSLVATVNTDVVVVGAGVSGLSAAAAAADKGLKVVLLEKSAKVQGRGGGFGVAGSTEMTKLNITFDAREAKKQWVRTAGSRINERLLGTFFQRSPDAMNWLLGKVQAQQGITLMWGSYSRDPEYPDQPGYHVFMNKDASQFGPAWVVQVLRDDFLTHAGCSIIYSSPATQLVKESGRVTAVIAKDATGYTRYNASKGVVLATGDIASDTELLDYYCPAAKAATSVYTPVGANTGDGHKMGLWVGGAMQDGPFPMMLHPQLYAQYHAAFLFLNQKGERFMDEATWVQGKALSVLRQPGKVAYAIMDSNWLSQVEKGLPYGGGMFWDNMMRLYGGTFDEKTQQTQMQTDIDAGVAFTADTLEALAGKIDVPWATMKGSIDRYNALVQAGSDTDFYKDPVFLGPISSGPFYATKIGAALLAIVGGLKIDTTMHVLDTSGAAIPGLLAVGNASGDLHAVDYAINVPGNSHGRALTWGYLAAETLAAS